MIHRKALGLPAPFPRPSPHDPLHPAAPRHRVPHPPPAPCAPLHARSPALRTPSRRPSACSPPTAPASRPVLFSFNTAPALRTLSLDSVPSFLPLKCWHGARGRIWGPACWWLEGSRRGGRRDGLGFLPPARGESPPPPRPAVRPHPGQGPSGHRPPGVCSAGLGWGAEAGGADSTLAGGPREAAPLPPSCSAQALRTEGLCW